MSSEQTLRSLPSIDSLLKSRDLIPAIESCGRAVVRDHLRAVLEALRLEIANGRTEEITPEAVISLARARLIRRDRKRTIRVINATGVILHTNLGRAPLGPEALAAIGEAARSYSNLEFDLETGARGRRGSGLEAMLLELLGCEAIVVVNNCAAAVYLTLNTLAEGGEVIVSRGELIEIGGSFRLPDVIEKSGARIREVGTTNRTRLGDYRKAITEDSRVLLRSHPSNYRIIGFTERPSAEELASLAQETGTVFFEDLGSGAMLDLTPVGIPGEPTVRETLRAGADLVAFSGDKLLGGPQAGIICGRRNLIDQIRANPLMRAFRVDKLTYAGLEATVACYLRGDESSIPALSYLALGLEEIGARAEALTSRLRKAAIACTVIDGNSVPGGGTAPAAEIPTKLIHVEAEGVTAAELEARLRAATPPVIARIDEDRLVVDLRTVAKDEEEELFNALVASSRGAGRLLS